MPKTTVAAIIKRDESAKSEILLARRNHDPYYGFWCLPGGHIEPNEPALEAVIREVKEETGLDFAAHFFSYFDEIIPERHIHAVVLVFAGLGTGAVQAQAEEVSETGWFTISQAQALPLAFQHNAILDAYAARTNEGVTVE